MSGSRNDIVEEQEAALRLSAAFGVLAQHWAVPEVELGPLEPGFTPVAALFGAEPFITAMLARQQAATPGLDEKGAAAFFIAEYANLLGIVAAVPYLDGALVPDLAPSNCALAFALPPGERPRVRLRFLRATCVRGEWAILRAHLRTVLVAHMEPLILRLEQRTGLPPQAMWRLVADAVAARFLEAGQKLDCEDEARTEALAVLKEGGSPLANPQLHFYDIVIHDEAAPPRVLARRTFRARGGCCRYYTVPGGSYCSSCVLVDPHERRRRMEAKMRHRLGVPVAEDVGAHDLGRENGTSR